MRPRLEVVCALAFAAVCAHAQSPADAKPTEPKPAADAKPAGDAKSGGGMFGFGDRRSKDPITITSDNLEYDYKNGVIVYRGEVLALQGEVKIRSNELRITLRRTEGKDGEKSATGIDDASTSKVQSIVASGSVRIDQGARWAVGGKATFDQSNRTLVLTESPVLHDGPNEVAGDRVVVYLDEDRSVVEGGRKRVKAVLFPGKENGVTASKDKDKTPEQAR